MSTSVNLNGIDQLVLNFDGVTSATLTAPGEVTVTNSGAGGVGTPNATDQTSVRNFGVTYTAPRAMFINIVGSLFLGVGKTGTISAIVNDSTGLHPITVALNTISNGSAYTMISFWVPEGGTYIASNDIQQPGDNSHPNLTRWIEWTFS